MAKQEPNSPAATVTPTGTPGVLDAATYGRGTTTQFSSTTSDSINRDAEALSSADANVGQKRVLQDLYAEYYERGINILKPEIILSTEFVPIQVLPGTSGDPESTSWDGFQINAGEQQIPVSQVLRLIELHRDVQDAVNLSAISAINTVAGFDVNYTLGKIKTHYSNTVLRSNLDDSTDAFINYLTTSVSDQEDPLFAIFGGFDPSTQEYRSFRILAEMVILEQVQIGICEYFSKVVDLRRKIYELIDFRTNDETLATHSSVDSISSSNILTYLENEQSKKIFTSLNLNYGHVPETELIATNPVPGTYESGVKMDYVSQLSSTKTQEFLNPQDIATFGLRVSNFNNALTNSGILYTLLHSAILHSGIPNIRTRSEVFDSEGQSLGFRTDIIDSLEFGAINEGATDRSSFVDKVKANYQIATDTIRRRNSNFRAQLEEFLKLGTSSFTLGPIARVSATEMTADDGDFTAYRLYYYGANHHMGMNFTTKNVVGESFFTPSQWYEDPIFRRISRSVHDINSKGENGSKENRNNLMRLYSYLGSTKLASMAELYALCLFDVVADVNARTDNFSEFGTTVDLSKISSDHTGTYMTAVLGAFGSNAAEGNDREFYNSAYRTYLSDGITPNPSRDFGIFEDILLGKYEILSSTSSEDAKLGMFPSETILSHGNPRTLPGHLGIPTEAFVKNNYESLDQYINNLTDFVNNVATDIMKTTGLGVVTDSTGVSIDNDDSIASSRNGMKSPSGCAREMLYHLGDALEDDFLEMIDIYATMGVSRTSVPPPDADTAVGVSENDNGVGLNQNGLYAADAFNTKYDSGLMALPWSLAFAILAGEDSSDEKSNGILTDFFGTYYYQTILRQRGQDQNEGNHQKWFGRHSYDCLNSLIQRFCRKLGLPMLHPTQQEDMVAGAGLSGDYFSQRYQDDGEAAIVSLMQDLYYATAQDDDYHRPYYIGHVEQYLNKQSSQSSATGTPKEFGHKGSFVNVKSDSLRNDETVFYFGPDSTKSLFKKSRDRQTWENAVETFPQLINDSLNDTITDNFMPGGLHGATSHVNSGQSVNGYYFPSVIHRPMISFKRHVGFNAGNYMEKRFAGEGPHAGATSNTSQQNYINNSTPRVGASRTNYNDEEGRSNLFYNNSYNYNPAEDIARTSGPLRTNEIQRDFATFSMICGVLSKCVNMMYVVGGGDLKYSGYGFFVDRFQIQGVADALKGVAKRTSEALLSQNDSATGGALCIAGDENALELGEDSAQYKVYSQSYDNCLEAMREVLRPAHDRENSVRICLSAVYQHIAKLNKAKSLISSLTNSSTLSTRIKLGLDFVNATLSESETDDSTPINNVKSEMLRYVTPASTATMYKNAINAGTSSRNRPLFSPIDSFSEEQVHLMTLALTGMKSVGISAHEKMGSKSIITVGVPPNLIESLRIDAITNSENSAGGASPQTSNDNISFSDTPYICIHLFKQDSLGGTLKYCPKPFLFNTSILDIENFSSTVAEEADHILNAADISSYDQLLDNFCLYRVDYETGDLLKVKDASGMKNNADDLSYMNDSESSEFVSDTSSSARKVALNEMRENHILDHYLKMYMRLTTGLDVGEHIFPLKSEDGLNYSGTGNAGRGVDNDKIDIFNSFRDELFIRYPSINVDPELRSEFGRLESTCRKSKYFTSRKRARTISSVKSFSRTFSMLVNESDFVVYPNSSEIRFASGPDSSGGGLPRAEELLIENIQQLYDGGCYFHLGAGRQIEGVHPDAKSSLLFNSFVTSELSPLLGHDTLSSMIDDASVRTKSLLRHIEEIETGNVADVYQIFAVVSLVRKS